VNPLATIAMTSSRHPWITLAAALLITGLFLLPASQLSIDTSVESAFGDNPPGELAELQNLSETFGEQNLVTVVVDCTASNRSTAEQYLQQLAAQLGKNDWFTDIRYTANLDFAGQKSLLYLPAEHLSFLLDPNITTASANDTYQQLVQQMNQPAYIVSENGNIYLLNLILSVTIDSAETRTRVFDGLHDTVDEVQASKQRYDGLNIGVTGGFMVMDYEGDQMALNDMYLATIITFVLIFILLFLAFKSISLPVLSLIPLLCSIIITAGILHLVFGAMGMIAMVFAVLVLGLGIDFSIHMLTRFMEEMEHRNDVVQAFGQTLVHTGKAIILGTLTTTTAFGALFFGRTQGLQEMGLVLAIGLLVNLGCVLFMLPALVALRLRVGRLCSKIAKQGRFTFLGAVGRFSAHHAVVLAVLLVVIGGFFAASVPRASVTGDLHELQPTDTQAYRQLEKVKANFNYSEDFLLCTAGSYNELVDDVQGFRSIDELMTVESILEYLPRNQSDNLAVIKQAKQLHPSLATLPWLNVTEMTWRDLPEHIRRDWVAERPQGPVFLIRVTAKGDIYDQSYREALLVKMEQVNDDVVGQAIAYPDIMTAMTDDVMRVSVVAAMPILAIVYIGFRKRSPAYALLALVPVLFGIGGLVGLSSYLGVSLNIISIMMIPLVIGIGIDDGIHILHRYKEEGRGSLPRVVQRTGKAIFLTTATTCLAFSSLLFADHPGMRAMAQTPVLGLILCFLAAILFLPALIRLLLERRQNDA